MSPCGTAWWPRSVDHRTASGPAALPAGPSPPIARLGGCLSREAFPPFVGVQSFFDSAATGADGQPASERARQKADELVARFREEPAARLTLLVELRRQLGPLTAGMVAEVARRLPFLVIKPLVTADWWEKTFDTLEKLVREVPAYRLRFDLSGRVADVLADL